MPTPNPCRIRDPTTLAVLQCPNAAWHGTRHYHCERDLRHLVVGRNNYQIFASERGGEVACRLYSLVLSAKLNGVDPLEYFEDCLQRLSTTPHSRIAELTPWGWAAARRAKRDAQAN